MTPTRRTPSLWLAPLTVAGALVVLGGLSTSPVHAAAAKANGTCPSRSVGAVTADAKGQPLVCTKISRTKFQWKLPALGSYLRPIPLGQEATAGPAANRFRVRVTQVDLDASAEIAGEFQYATPPPADTSFVRVGVQATYAGPAATGVTGHYWYARVAVGTDFPSSTGCGGGYGSDFNVDAAVAVGQSVSGTHCFEIKSADVASLRLMVQGADRSDVHFALR